MNELKDTIIRGWPDHKDGVPSAILPYFSYRDELTVQDEPAVPTNNHHLLGTTSAVPVPQRTQPASANQHQEYYDGIDDEPTPSTVPVSPVIDTPRPSNSSRSTQPSDPPVSSSTQTRSGRTVKPPSKLNL
ncbi:hypothetical protein PoB_005291900 [Plakobranchus ocellatus]|uniref:Uncharacterized protein n=1 Tax=Plakobranchus ocellatus TaxID=259542 RepID=A0AAV4C6W8_9GAST|nr:hypothetical protein PoB_005291900 [Plakobranchus ocellatus]